MQWSIKVNKCYATNVVNHQIKSQNVGAVIMTMT